MCSLYFCRKTTHTCVTLSANASANNTSPRAPLPLVNVSADGCAHSEQPSDVVAHQRSRACSILTFQLSFAFCCSLTSSAFCASRITRRDRYRFCSHSTFFVDLCFRHTSGSCSFCTEIYRAAGTVYVAKGVLILTLRTQNCKYDAAADTAVVRLFRFVLTRLLLYPSRRHSVKNFCFPHISLLFPFFHIQL